MVYTLLNFVFPRDKCTVPMVQWSISHELYQICSFYYKYQGCSAGLTIMTCSLHSLSQPLWNVKRRLKSLLKMIHDLLFALQGIPGDIFQFTETGLKSNAPVQVSMTQLPWIQPGEYATSLELLKTFGCPFFALQNYIKSTISSSSTNSLYLEALAYGLKTISQEYIHLLADIEHSFISTVAEDNYAILAKNSPFSEIRMRLSPFKSFMASVIDLLNQLKSIEGSGGNIVPLLFDTLSKFTQKEYGTESSFYSR
jgi:hypothetical protein